MRNLDYDALDRERRSALQGRDALRYFELCNALGVPQSGIEDLHLYELGDAENIFAEKMLLTATEMDGEKYRRFLAEARDVSSDLGAGSDRKRELLEKHFPGRFGRGGGQDLEAKDYRSAQIGAIFKKMKSYAEKRK